MKEVLLFTLSSKVDETIQDLGGMGVVEIREITPAKGEKIDRITEIIASTEKSISILEKYSNKTGDSRGRIKYKSNDPVEIVERVLVSGKIKKNCKTRLDDLQRQLKWYETWGREIDIDDFTYLAKQGIYIHLYLIDKPDLKLIPRNHVIELLPEKGNKIPVVLFALSPSEKLAFKEDPVPEIPLEEIKERIVRKKRQLEEVEFYLSDQAENISILHDFLTYLHDRLNVRKALAGMGNIDDSIKYLRGFIPHKEVDAFKLKAQRKRWGYQIKQPENPEEVPVYIKNPKWVSIINPVMKFIDIVPGYKEVDVSIYFLVAFALFFAMLVGDAGYGALFLLTAFLLRKKMSSQVQFLIYVLSGATIIWGVLSGTYFGSEAIAGIPFFKNLIVPEIASFGVDNISFMMHLSFLIGAIHLTIAHFIRVVTFINSIKTLSEIGWIAFVWGLYFLAEQLVLGTAMPEWSHWLFIGGAVLVTLFSKEGKTFVSSMLTSAANLPLSLINGFSDIVSYVRLFAVGMATATVASSFNNMILPQGVDLSFLELLLAVVALILGHGLNIALALMAVMVHGIRLNMLEFAGHLGVQFSGKEYQPFKLKGVQKESIN